MIVLNYEGDELLMNICMKVKTTKYYAVFPKGTKYHLTDKYRQNGRFNRKSVELYFAKKGLKLEDNYTIVTEEDYTGKEDLAMFLIQKQIRKIYHVTKCEVINFWLGPSGDDEPNFRFNSAVTEPYKSDRADKPAIREMLRNWLITTQGAQIAHGYEADDMLGIHQITLGDHAHKNNESIACHVDKDINQIPGWHYNWQTDIKWWCGELGELWLDDKRNLKGCGLAWFYAQMLLGDKTDTVPSLKPGFGEIKVYNYLKDCKEEVNYLELVVKMFHDELGDSYLARLYEQADLVWICRNKEEKGRDYIQRRLKELLK